VDSGDVVRHERHGVGVVLTPGQPCQVRFLSKKGQVNAATLTVLLPADCADQFTAEVLKTSQIEAIAVGGATLWLRSDDPHLRATALSAFSESTDPWLLMTANKSLVQFPPGARSRVTSDLSQARLRRGLEPWPEAVQRAVAELESRRVRQESERKALLLAKAVRGQIDIIRGIHQRLGRPSPTDAERVLIEQEVRARAAWAVPRESFCWKCHKPLHSIVNPDCPICRWMVCVCGACRDPHRRDKLGRTPGACRQEASLLSAQVHPESQELPF
jgi:hypothetical protein